MASCTVRPLAGGNVAGLVEQVTLHLTGGHGALELVRKEVPALEIAGLRAAQAVRPDTTAIPELVAWGTGWLITPLAPGSPLTRGDAAPANLPDTLAALQIPVQYLPWTTGHLPTRDVEAALDRIEQALGQLPA